MFYPGHIRVPLAEQGPALRGGVAAAGRVPARRWSAAGLTPDGGERRLHAHALALARGGGDHGDPPGHQRPSRPHDARCVGACGWDEVAYSVLATVVSTAVPGQAVIDAGSKALAKEELPRRGRLRRAAGPAGGGGARRSPRSTGCWTCRAPTWRPRVGERVRVVPNHVCVSVNLQDALWALEGGRVAARWRVAARGW